jgi:O-antigen ligase
VASVEQPPVEAENTVGAGVLDLYRSIWRAGRAALIRYRVAIVVELALIAAWVVLRTAFSVESRPYLAWTIVAAGVALVSPTSGLVIFVATAPFFEPVDVSRALGMRHLLVAALGISVALRLVIGGWRRMAWPAPVRLALAVGVVTLLGVANTWRLFPADWATHATQTWLASIGGAMILLVVGTWVAGTGARRFILAVVASSTIAVALSLVELFVPGSISTSRLEWVGFWRLAPRLSGAIASPNGMAALTVMPVCVLSAFAVLGRGRTLRLLAAAAAAVLFVAMYVTYSRAALLSLFGLAVVVAWRLHRRLGQAVFVVGIVAGILLLPTYLQLRGQAGSAGASEPGSLLVATDRDRITAWQAAVAMTRDEPLTGHGFLAYKQLGDAYGDPVLSSPHNEWLRLFAEEGVVGGLLGLAFVATTLSWLSHGRGALAAGILAGTTGYFTMATFNNPFLFIQVSAVIYPLVGYALVSVARARNADTIGIDEPPPDAPAEATSSSGR